MIVTKNLTKKFDDFTAVKGVNIQVAAGELLALLGPNGAGKTTTVRMLTSVLRPTSGSARVAGFDVVEDAAKVRATVGVLTEHHGLYNRMRAMEYLMFFGEIYGLSPEARRERAAKMLSDFGLEDARDKRIGEFSKGMRQKLALGRALIHEPQVLLLDEPTSAMDPASARLVRDAIKELRSDERAIIICTHNLAEAEELADCIAIIRRGKIIANDSPTALKQKMLGPPIFEVRFSDKMNGNKPSLPKGLEIQAKGNNWLQYCTETPNEINPQVVKHLVKQGLPVVSIQETTRSLEQVYLQIVSTPESEEELEHVR